MPFYIYSISLIKFQGFPLDGNESQKQLQEDEWFGAATHLWTSGAGGEALWSAISISFMVNYVISDW